MRHNVLETLLGALVLVVAGLFLAFAYSSSHIRATPGYAVTARFDHVDGIHEGGDVRISGIKVGTISSETLDPKTFQAVVRLNIDREIQLPVDTVATIASSGLLGDKFLSLVPGNDDKTIPPDGMIGHTQSPASLEDLIGKFMYAAPGGSTTPAGDAPKP
jgi:phospholipid/cholesterol/gamma-HCH transport system substrate-binding protein